MTATPGRLRSLLAASDAPVAGCFCTLPSSLVAEAIAAAGFPAVVVDLQHGAISWDTVTPLLQAVELGGADAVVRVAWNEPQELMKALDLGARAVIVPMVDTAEQAASAAVAMRYPPDGVRSYGPARRRYADVADANADVLFLPMIETAEGLRNVEAIAATPGVDGLFVGPADLGLALGAGLDLTMAGDAVTAGVDACVAAAARHGRFVGTVAADADHAADLARRGVRFVTLGSDKSFVATGAAQARRALDTALDAARPNPTEESR